MRKQKALELRNIKRTYLLGDTEVHALQGITMHVEKGDFVSITGPSGSGKSTLLHILGCLDTPTSGKRYVDGHDTSKMDDNALAVIRRKKVGFIFQQYNLLPRFTALENVTFPMWLSGMHPAEMKERAGHLLDIVGLSHRKYHSSSQLSGGERQRVAIARALSNEPAYLLADEPTGNLDSKTGKEIIELLRKVRKEENVALIVVTHDQQIARRAQKHIRIKDGLIVN